MDNVVQPDSPPKCVVVATDFSVAAGYALELSVELLRAGTYGELHVVHVARPPIVIDPLLDGDLRLSPSVAVPVHRARKRLEDACAEVMQRTRRRVVPHLRFGGVIAELAEVCRTVGADILVVGAPDRPGWRLRWLGSLPARLVRCAPCSVLAVRTKSPKLDARALAG
jgi:nucleotide-binding universal stress UspA family protein